MGSAYLVTLVLLCAAYGICIYFMKYMRNRRLFNGIFVAVIFLIYIAWSGIVYQKSGFCDWNFQNTLPVANISPFMFFTVPLLLVLPEKWKQHYGLLIALLSVGMFGAAIGGCISNFARNYRFHFHFLLDFIAHGALSLLGIYLIRSRQVILTVKNAVISGSVLLVCASVFLILNLIFDTAFWGLSLQGMHNIYNMVISENSYVSATVYYLGVIGVLALGFGLCSIFAKVHFQIPEKQKTP